MKGFIAISLSFFIFLFILAFFLIFLPLRKESSPSSLPSSPISLVPTYLGNEARRFYGRGAVDRLEEITNMYLGKGETWIRGRKISWRGIGWTGQPILISSRGTNYLIIGSGDGRLRKFNLKNFSTEWSYAYPDVIKGTATFCHLQDLDSKLSSEEKWVVVQGSRSGLRNIKEKKPAYALRGLSFQTGRELWRIDIPLTDSWSRDNDSSPLYLGEGKLFNAAENGMGYFLEINRMSSFTNENGVFNTPLVQETLRLYTERDKKRQGKNLVSEASPARWGNIIYQASGSGHIYGIDITTEKIVWDYFVGGDINGTVAINREGKLFCSIEKQYIKGHGGLLKLDPKCPPQEATKWFLPVPNTQWRNWQGGIIGSAAINDEYNRKIFPKLFAVISVNGMLYVGAQSELSSKRKRGPHNKKYHPLPRLVYHEKISEVSISTPIFTDENRLVAAGLGGVFLYQIYFRPVPSKGVSSLLGEDGRHYLVQVKRISRFKGRQGRSRFEATPVVWKDRLYIASRDGYLYVLGKKPERKVSLLRRFTFSFE